MTYITFQHHLELTRLQREEPDPEVQGGGRLAAARTRTAGPQKSSPVGRRKEEDVRPPEVLAGEGEVGRRGRGGGRPARGGGRPAVDDDARGRRWAWGGLRGPRGVKWMTSGGKQRGEW